jgi:hypothetical protein
VPVTVRRKDGSIAKFDITLKVRGCGTGSCAAGAGLPRRSLRRGILRQRLSLAPGG